MSRYSAQVNVLFMALDKDEKVGVRSIAKQAGVSTATVSRVLNHSEKVSESTRQRVLNAMSDSNFHPNAAAKALATARTKTIAAVIPTLEHSVFAVFMNAVEDELATSGYNLVIATHGFCQQTELTRCRDVLALGAEALIVTGTSHATGFEKMIADAGAVCVYTSTHDATQTTTTFGYDNFACGEKAIAHLHALGHRRIQVIHSDVASNDRASARLRGIEQYVEQQRNIALELKEVELSVAGGVSAVQDWQGNSLPDACLCLSDVIALGVLFEAQRQKIAVPDSVSVMGFENLTWARHAEPSLTTIELPAAEMGKATASALVKFLDNQEPLQHHLLDARIIERQSTKAR